MKNSRQSPNSSSVEAVTIKASAKTDQKILGRNPKIDRQLLAEYERLVDNSKGAIRAKKPGADYHLSHPFGSNVVPTDPREIGKRLSDVRRS